MPNYITLAVASRSSAITNLGTRDQGIQSVMQLKSDSCHAFDLVCWFYRTADTVEVLDLLRTHRKNKCTIRKKGSHYILH